MLPGFVASLAQEAAYAFISGRNFLNFGRDKPSAVNADNRESPNCQPGITLPTGSWSAIPQPLLAHEYPRSPEEIRIVDRWIGSRIRKDRRFDAIRHVRAGGVVVLAELSEQPVEMSVVQRLDVAQQFIVQCAMEVAGGHPVRRASWQEI